MDITDCKIIELPKIVDPRGNLSIIEQLKQIPFEIKRVYWIYDVPGGEARGGHRRGHADRAAGGIRGQGKAGPLALIFLFNQPLLVREIPGAR